MTELRVAPDSLSGEGAFSGGRFPPSGCEQEPRAPVSSFFAQTLVLLTVKSGLHVRVRPGVSAVFARAILGVCFSRGEAGTKDYYQRPACSLPSHRGPPGGQQQMCPCGVDETVTKFIFLWGEPLSCQAGKSLSISQSTSFCAKGSWATASAQV